MPLSMPLKKLLDRMLQESLKALEPISVTLCATPSRILRITMVTLSMTVLAMIIWENGMDSEDSTSSMFFTKPSARDGLESQFLLFPQRRLLETKIWFSFRKDASILSNSSARLLAFNSSLKALSSRLSRVLNPVSTLRSPSITWADSPLASYTRDARLPWKLTTLCMTLPRRNNLTLV